MSSVISVEQAADYLQCAADRVYRLIHNEELTATKINRYWYVSESSLKLFFWQELCKRGRALLESSEYSAAYTLFQSVVRHFPDRKTGHYFSGWAAERQNDPITACVHYEYAKNTFHDLRAYKALARLYFQQKEYKQALKNYLALEQRRDLSQTELYNLGLTYLHLEQFEDAQTCFEDVVAENPAHPQAYYALGHIAVAEQLPAEALSFYQSALTLDPRNSDYQYALGYTYASLKKYAPAVDWIQKSLSTPGHPEAYFTLAKIYHKQKKPAEAIQAYTYYLRFFPYCGAGLNNLALLCLNESPHEALRLLQRALKQMNSKTTPPSARLSKTLAYNLALAHIYVDQPQEAQRIYEELLQASDVPDGLRSRLYLGLAYALHAANDPESAQAMCRKAREIPNIQGQEDADELSARLHYARKDFAAALSRYQDIYQRVASSEARSAACYHMALCHWGLKDETRALQMLQEAEQLHPEQSQTSLALGYIYQQKRGFLKAIRYYYRALALDAKCLRALYNLGQIYAEQQDFQQALKWFTKLLKIYPTHLETHIQTGFAHDNLGDLRTAIACYRQALRLTPDNIVLYIILGLAYSRNSQYKKALAVYQQALAHQPEDLCEIYYLMGLANLNANRPQAAIEVFEKALKYGGKNACDAANHLGQLYLNQKNTRQAIRCFRHAIGQDMQDAQSYLNLARAYGQLKDLKHAYKYARRALVLQPKNPEVLYQVALFYYRQEAWRDAIPLFQKVIKLNPDHASAHNYLGTIFRSMGCNLDALKSFRKSLEIDPDYSVGYLNLSYTYFDLNEITRAIYFCKEAIRCEPECEEPLFWLGHLYYQTQNWSAAIHAFEQVVQLNPEHVKVNHWLPIARKQLIRERNGTQPLVMSQEI